METNLYITCNKPTVNYKTEGQYLYQNYTVEYNQETPPYSYVSNRRSKEVNKQLGQKA